MSTSFNVNEYWLNRGRTYMGEQRMPLAFHRRQEQVLLDILKRGKIPLQRVLELGCGYGRITRLLAQDHPNTDITALDLSPEQLANARRYCADYARVRFEEFDLFPGNPCSERIMTS